MLNNYKYNEHGDLQVVVKVPKWYMDNRKNRINRPDNEYFIKCGNVIVSVPYASDVLYAIMAQRLAMDVDLSENDTEYEMFGKGRQDFGKIYSDSPIAIEMSPNIWISNDRQAIEKVQSDPVYHWRIDKLEEMFLILTGQERL